MGYFLALDQGTTGTTAILVEEKSLKFIDKVNQEYKQIYPQPGWVEHNLNDIWKSVESTVLQLLSKTGVKSEEIVSIGITNQRETICAFDTQGKPLYHALVWQDRRMADFCKQQPDSSKEMILRLTGLPLDPYFSATKMHWLLNNSIEVQEYAKKGQLHFGTIDTYLLYKLTNGVSFKTEPSNASRTLLVNIATGDYDPALLSHFGVKRPTLPDIVDSFGEFGRTKGLSFLPDGIPIQSILGDQQAALFGQTCVNKGELKCTYGTGAFLLVNTGSDIVRSSNGLLSTIAFQHKGKRSYALEGSSFIAGAAVQWLRDNLQLFADSKESETLAEQVDSLNTMKDVFFFPFFSGIGSPRWISTAKASIIGMTRDTNRNHITRACLEGICFSINDLIKAMQSDLGSKIEILRVDGGAVANNLLMDIQSTISDLTIERPVIIETTAYGVILGAALARGQISLDELGSVREVDRVFGPSRSDDEYYRYKKSEWDRLINKLY